MLPLTRLWLNTEMIAVEGADRLTGTDMLSHPVQHFLGTGSLGAAEQ
jgi:hypothetical protein